MTKDQLLDLIYGRNGYAGYLKKWWNPCIYGNSIQKESYKDYLQLSIENNPEGIYGRNTNYWIDELESHGIENKYIRETLEPEILQGQLSLF